MNYRRIGIVGAVLLASGGSVPAVAHGEPGPYARIAILRANDGQGIE